MTLHRLHVFIVYLTRLLILLSVTVLYITTYHNLLVQNSIGTKLSVDINDSTTTTTFLIFQIGFPRMGTTSLRQFFHMNNISSIQDYSLTSPKIKHQIELSKPTFGFDNITDKYRYFGDFCAPHPHCKPKNESHEYLYQDIIYYYPNSKFILNIRNLNHWLKSLWLFYGSHGWMLKKKKLFYWHRKRFHQYICHVVTNVYNNKSIRDNLLIFDIEEDHISKLVKFFSNFNLYLDSSVWAQYHSAKSEAYSKQKQEEYMKRLQTFNEFVTNNPQFSANYIANNTYDYIKAICTQNTNVTYYQ